MLPLAYFKAEPTEYILVVRNGRIARRGAGRSFWYWRPSTAIMLLPTATIDALFVLNETTSNFQPVTLQGQVTYRIVAPETTADLLNFTIDPRTRAYRSTDPTKLNQRIVNLVQTHLRAELRQLTLEDALRGSERLTTAVLARMQGDTLLAALGVACLSLFFTTIATSPELARALEAQYREALQQRADQAIYARRAEAVEQERKIKQNELATALDLEQRRRTLVDLEGENARAAAIFAAEALRTQLAAYQTVDERMVLAVAFRDFASNAEKIGNLTIGSDIVAQLMNGATHATD